MSIKMGFALDKAEVEWKADSYTKGQGAEPLRCIHCPTKVTHQSAHVRERESKSYWVSAYFRLFPNSRHEPYCKFNMAEKVAVIAKASEGLLSSIQDGRFRFRLAMINAEINERANALKKEDDDKKPVRGRINKEYIRATTRLTGYVNTAKRVLLLRSACDDDDEISQYLELVFEGNTIVPWSQFYFETDGFIAAYHCISKNAQPHPMAMQGTVLSVKDVDTQYGKRTVMSLEKAKYSVSAEDEGVGVGASVEIWTKNAAWLKEFKPGAEVIVFGIWKAKPGVLFPLDGEKGRFKAIRTHIVSTSLMLKSQIVDVEN